MKVFLFCLVIFMTLPSATPKTERFIDQVPVRSSGRLVIITLDGVRWQEVFRGADPSLLGDVEYTADTSSMNLLYGGESGDERRKRLMPFLWSVISRKGQLYGNRDLRSRMNVSNIYSFSYPGYHEMFTGNTDLAISSNKKKHNPHKNVLEYLNGKKDFSGKVAAFTSWDVFPYILGQKRNGLLVNSGYDNMEENGSATFAAVNQVQSDVINEHVGTRKDQLTFITAKEYMAKNNPSVVLMGLGESDEYAHSGHYDNYLESISKADQMIAELWNWIQSTPGYKNNTSLLVTTDHGRGSKHDQWTSHGFFIKGSSQTWMALMGPGVDPVGECRNGKQLYQQQLASLMANLVGEEFGDGSLLTKK
ncbi:MAG: phosphoglyceromutase [Chitinophagaceae bacterium]|nr:MAG: phosphoglyceromutase [Chitinophagaceae bacterium]